MILSRRASLGNVMLDELHETILIQKMEPGIAQQSINATDRMGGFGQRVTGEHWSSIDAKVSFTIMLYKHDMELRRQVFDTVIAWAKANQWLEFSNMPDRHLYVDKVILPDSGDLFKQEAEYTITFRAYNVPFWQQIKPNTANVKNITEGSTQIEVGGTAPSVLDISFRNISGKTIQNISINAAGKRMVLNDVNLGASETLKVTHGTDGLLKITAGSRNVYGIYTGDDDLLVEPGMRTVSISATRAGELTVTNYGRFY